ncbi:hypothetical protein GCM10010276_83370 [Streptomyces longisporus]|uniref:Uncharacterized protein n=1 Tax=Streptomyces longisporus TaxID=1948 RepID=A0ABN3NET8_STRLO
MHVPLPVKDRRDTTGAGRSLAFAEAVPELRAVAKAPGWPSRRGGAAPARVEGAGPPRTQAGKASRDEKHPPRRPPPQRCSASASCGTCEATTRCRPAAGTRRRSTA